MLVPALLPPTKYDRAGSWARMSGEGSEKRDLVLGGSLEELGAGAFYLQGCSGSKNGYISASQMNSSPAHECSFFLQLR